jgi:uncharacterized protein
VRIVIDTNVLLSGLLWHGAPHHLLNHARNGDIELVLSHSMLEELAETLAKPKFAIMIQRTGLTHEQMLNELHVFVESVIAPPLDHPVCRDPDDDMVLACALAANVNIIVTGDNDLLVLHPWQGIEIVKPAEALQQLSIGN